MDGERESDARSGAAAFALAHGRGKRVQDFAVDFVKGHFDGANTVPRFTASGNESRREGACSRARIQKSHRIRERPKHRRHEGSHRRRGEKLSEFLLPVSWIGCAHDFHCLRLPRRVRFHH